MSERDQFEKWAMRRGYDVEWLECVEPNYRSKATQMAWADWKDSQVKSEEARGAIPLAKWPEHATKMREEIRRSEKITGKDLATRVGTDDAHERGVEAAMLTVEEFNALSEEAFDACTMDNLDARKNCRRIWTVEHERVARDLHTRMERAYAAVILAAYTKGAGR